MKKYLSNLFKLLSIIVFIGNLSCHAQKKVSAVSLFDGATLIGWKTVNAESSKYWSIIDSTITGGDGVNDIPTNTYLYNAKSYKDFEFSCLFRLTGNADTGLINSGIQYRSVVQDNKIIGYQADIGKGYWGDIYDEHRRGKLVGGDLSTLKNILNEDGWNSYLIRCQGNKQELYINGIKTSEYYEETSEIPSNVVISIQLHSGGNAKAEFKYLTITIL